MKTAIRVSIKMGLMMLVLLLLLVSTVVHADVPGQISFQGYLTDGDGLPVPDDTYTMIFYLYDQPLGGNQLWNPNNGEEQDVEVTDGIYNVQLGVVQPLDSGVFDGGVAWLEVVIDGETLSPRQRVTATAYALKAGDADSLAGNAVVDLDARYVNEGQVGVVSSAMIHDSAVTADDLDANSVGSSEIASNAVSTDEVANDSLTFEDILDGPGSKLNADLLDDLDSTSFFVLNQHETVAGRPAFYGGTTGATPPFYVDSTYRVANLNADYLDGLHSSSFMAAGADNWVNTTGDTMTGMLTTSTAGRGILVDANSIAGNLYGVSIDADQSSANNFTTYGLYVDSDSAAATATTYAIYSSGDGNGTTYGVYGRAQSDNDIAYGVYGWSYAPGTTSDYHVGVGGYSNVPAGSSASSYGFRSTAYHYGTGPLYGDANFTWHYGTDGNSYGTYTRAYGSDNGTTYGVYAEGLNSPTNYGIYAAAAGGTTNYAGFFNGDLIVDSGSTTALAFRLEPDGYSGNPEFAMVDDDNEMKVQIVARETSTTEGAQLLMWDEDGTNTIELDAEYGGDGGGYLALRNGDGTSTIRLDSDYSGNGRIITQELQITGGSDLSEQFDVKGKVVEITSGMVVSIDPEAPGHLQVSHTAYDNKVAGIISGAGGIKTGMMMGQQGSEADGQHPVALTGRVYCRADATTCAIQPGDLLTTSDIPGHAMKVTDHTRSNGAILGKAMTGLDDGTGLVLVLVSLQ